MTKLFTFLQTWLEARAHNDDRGASMVEYALLASLIAIFMIASITLARDAIAGVFTEIANAL